jgi:hypothetical protein
MKRYYEENAARAAFAENVSFGSRGNEREENAADEEGSLVAKNITSLCRDDKGFW